MTTGSLLCRSRATALHKGASRHHLPVNHLVPPNIRSQRIAPFARSSNNVNAVIVNTIFLTDFCIVYCIVLHPYNCKHVCELLVSVSAYHSYHLLFSCYWQVASSTAMCRHLSSCHGCVNVSTVISLFLHLNVSVETNEHHVFVRMQLLYMRPQVCLLWFWWRP